MNPAHNPKVRHRQRPRPPRPNPSSNDSNSLEQRLNLVESKMKEMLANTTQQSLNMCENTSIESSSTTSSKKSDSNSRRREKKENKKLTKNEYSSVQQVSMQMQELRIYNNGNMSHQVNGRSGPTDPQTSQNPKKDLLEQLNMIKKGKIVSETVTKRTSVPSEPSRHVNRQTLDEVNKINRNIEKLTKENETKCENVINMKLTFKNSVVYEVWKNSGVDVADVAVPKTKINDDTEIYRYSRNVLFQLIGLATRPALHIYKDLEKLKILRGNVSFRDAFSRENEELDDAFLKRLLLATPEEQKEIILKASERRKIIKRLEGEKFEFIEKPQKVVKIKDLPMKSTKNQTISGEYAEIEKQIDALLNNQNIADNIKNDNIYRIEFIHLFKEFIDDEMEKKSIEEITKFLIDNKFANIAEGEIRVNARNNQEAYISHPRGLRDPCVNRWGLRKQSLHGDIVKVLYKETKIDEIPETEPDDTLDLDSSTQNAIPSDAGIFGCVLDILEERHSRRLIGNLSSGNPNKKKISFVPRDTKVPKVQLKKQCLPQIFTEDELIVVEIIGWKHATANGRFIKKVGTKGELSTENSAILLQYNLDPTPYSQEIIDSLPNEEYKIPDEEFQYREDLRKKCIFSIDPETARDLDDAMSCEVLPNGNYEIGVHISDVSFFLKEGTKLDDIVKDKATTIYLVDTVYHMLPLPLCLLCSLLPGADKVAYSVFWEMNPKTAEIVNTRFTRSILNSCAKLSYDHAQMVIEKCDENWSDLEGEFPTIHNNFTVSDVADVIAKLHKIAVILRTKRKENGALKIDQPKISFKFTNNDQRMEAPIDFFQYCTKDSNRLIEEFMLLANISVAKMINEKFPKVSLLRRHDPPNATAMKKLVKNLEKHGIALDTSSSSAISDSMEQLIANAKDRNGMNACLNLIVSKTMSRARYFCSDTANDEQDFWHYALSIPIYTHFTSPIRRYADILVHRVLNAALDYEPETQRSPEEVQRLAEICNVQKYAAKLAGDDSCNLYFMHFIETLATRTMKVGVVGIFDFNLEVILIETGHVVKVMYQDLRKENIIVNPVTEGNPPRCVLINGDKTKTIVFGSELMTQIEVIKGKILIKTIFL